MPNTTWPPGFSDQPTALYSLTRSLASSSLFCLLLLTRLCPQASGSGWSCATVCSCCIKNWGLKHVQSLIQQCFAIILRLVQNENMQNQCVGNRYITFIKHFQNQLLTRNIHNFQGIFLLNSYCC